MSETYVVIKKSNPDTIIVASDSAKEISAYLWGKSIKDYSVYKAVRLFSAEVGEIVAELEKR